MSSLNCIDILHLTSASHHQKTEQLSQGGITTSLLKSKARSFGAKYYGLNNTFYNVLKWSYNDTVAPQCTFETNLGLPEFFRTDSGDLPPRCIAAYDLQLFYALHWRWPGGGSTGSGHRHLTPGRRKHMQVLDGRRADSGLYSTFNPLNQKHLHSFRQITD